MGLPVPERRSVWLRFVGAAVVAMHAAIHVVGFLLLWEIAEVGEFNYETATPAAGTAGGQTVGVLWLLAAVLFAATAFLLAIGSHRWRRVALAASLVSTPALLIDAGDAFAGLVVNAVLVALALRAGQRNAHRAHARFDRAVSEPVPRVAPSEGKPQR